MYSEDFGAKDFDKRPREDIYSKAVRAGKRTYFFDVKATRGNKDYFLTITERKRLGDKDGKPAYSKHKLFLYKEDFDKFKDALNEVVDYINTKCLPLVDADEEIHEESCDRAEGDACDANECQEGECPEDEEIF